MQISKIGEEAIRVHRIEIDDDVYRELERHVRGFEQPNDVLRRLLLKEAGERKTAASKTAVRGKLLPLIEAGSIDPGDQLSHTQRRKGRSFTAHVDKHGWVVTDYGSYKEPSPALRDLVGTQIDGWANWLHSPSGKTLRKLRAEIESAPADAHRREATEWGRHD